MEIYSSKMLKWREWVISNQILHHTASSAVTKENSVRNFNQKKQKKKKYLQQSTMKKSRNFVCVSERARKSVRERRGDELTIKKGNAERM
jgi:hypothetical protein